MAAELGQTTNPKDLVPGEPDTPPEVLSADIIRAIAEA
jgi:hypothetical protein